MGKRKDPQCWVINILAPLAKEINKRRMESLSPKGISIVSSFWLHISVVAVAPLQLSPEHSLFARAPNKEPDYSWWYNSGIYENANSAFVAPRIQLFGNLVLYFFS